MQRTLGVITTLAVAIWVERGWAGDDKGEEVVLGGLKSRTPAGWKKEKPESKLRTHEFRLARADGDGADAELAIFFFGPDGGGSVEQNIERWKGQFTPPKGKKIDDVTTVELFKVGEAKVTYVDISGTYRPPFKPKAEPLPDYRRLGAIFVTADGPYYIHVTGPAKTVAKHKKNFDDWLKAFK